jgi:hypothetical protein
VIRLGEEDARLYPLPRLASLAPYRTPSWFRHPDRGGRIGSSPRIVLKADCRTGSYARGLPGVVHENASLGKGLPPTMHATVSVGIAYR